jgi:hypothetical protein
MWLVINGVVLLKWDEVSSLSITDWEGNTVFLPITASVCTVLSIIAVIKVSRTNPNPKQIHYTNLQKPLDTVVS